VRLGHLYIAKAIEDTLGQSQWEGGWSGYPPDRWQKETEESLKQNDKEGNGVFLTPNNEVYQNRIDFLDSQGYRRGTVVCKADDKLVHRLDPNNWGFVIRMMWFKPEHLPKWKPIQVAWVNGLPDNSYYDDWELIILFSGPTQQVLIDKFQKEAHRRQCG